MAHRSLVPCHFPQGHADVHQTIDLEGSGDIVDRDQYASRVSDRRKPAKLGRTEGDGVIEQVPRNRWKLLLVPRRYLISTVEKSNSEHRLPAFLRQHARVVTNVHDRVEYWLRWQFHGWPAGEKRLAVPDLLKNPVQVSWVNTIRNCRRLLCHVEPRCCCYNYLFIKRK